MAEPRSVVARSPIAPSPPEAVIAGWVVSGRRSAAAQTLTDQTPLTKVAVKADWDGPMADVLGVRFGRSVRRSFDVEAAAGQVLLTGSGPGEWMALAAPGMAATVVDWLEKSAAGADELVTVVDLTHGRALVRLTGESSRDLLAKECAIELDDATFPHMAALRSAVAGVATDLVRDDQRGVPSYLLHCERSAGQYLFDSLLDAGREFGTETDGFVPPGI